MTISFLKTQSQSQPTIITQHAPFVFLFATVSGSGSDIGLCEGGFAIRKRCQPVRRSATTQLATTDQRSLALLKS